MFFTSGITNYLLFAHPHQTFPSVYCCGGKIKINTAGDRSQTLNKWSRSSATTIFYVITLHVFTAVAKGDVLNNSSTRGQELLFVFNPYRTNVENRVSS